MAKLIYSAITSLDGYVADASGNFDWAVPDDEVHAFVNNLERPIGTDLYGRRMYDVMLGWETMYTADDGPPLMRDFAELWRAADKIVYSTTLASPSRARTRIERHFDPESVRQAMKAGLVDECNLFLVPVIVGGGTPSLPRDVRVQLELLDVRRFERGVVYLHYRRTR